MIKIIRQLRIALAFVPRCKAKGAFTEANNKLVLIFKI